jgi:copper chaperone CopZ
MPREKGSIWPSPGSKHETDHEHEVGCGHKQIPHGDHFDWLIPDGTGSYVLKHALETAAGVSQFIDLGRLEKVGETLGQLKTKAEQATVDLFRYVSPKLKGYEIVPAIEEAGVTDVVNVLKSRSTCCMSSHSPQRAAIVQEDMVKVTIPRGFKGQGTVKTTFDVMGICCPSEVPLIKKILEPLPGVEEVLVNVTSKQVTVLHDPPVISDIQIGTLLQKQSG